MTWRATRAARLGWGLLLAAVGPVMGIDSYYSLGDSAVEALSVAAVVMAGAYLFWWLMFGRPAVKITGYMLQVQNLCEGTECRAAGPRHSRG